LALQAIFAQHGHKTNLSSMTSPRMKTLNPRHLAIHEAFISRSRGNKVRSRVLGNAGEIITSSASKQGSLGGQMQTSTIGPFLSSKAKCNTRRRFDIGKVVQDLKECCHAILCASVGGRKRPDRRFAGRGAVGGGPLPGRSVGRKPPSPRELQRNALPLGGYSPLHAAGAYQLRRRREAILEREAALRLFVGDRLAEGWTPEQISGWLKSGNEPRLRAIGCETIYGFIYRTTQKAAALWRYLTRRHKRRRPRRARGLAGSSGVTAYPFEILAAKPRSRLRPTTPRHSYRIKLSLPKVRFGHVPGDQPIGPASNSHRAPSIFAGVAQRDRAGRVNPGS